jgi:hypothetical protein
MDVPRQVTIEAVGSSCTQRRDWNSEKVLTAPYQELRQIKAA